MADEELPRSREAGLDDEGEGAQAAPAGRLEERQLQQLFVQVHGDVRPQLIWEVLQQLRRESEGKALTSAAKQRNTLLVPDGDWISLSALAASFFCVSSFERDCVGR